MKKKEWVITVCIVVAALLAVFLPRVIRSDNHGGENEHGSVVYADTSSDPYASASLPDWKASGEWIAVLHRNRVALYFDSGVDGVYELDGNVGHMIIEVKDGMWHVKDVECYDYTCKNMGWIGSDSLLPIICIPNDIVIVDAATAANMTGD